ncbi:MAG: FmdB family zinc ribbon protein [Candidatus Omnitrophota bacterium]
MPTYEYECRHCGYKFEVSQKITEKHLDNCPKCNNKINRLIGSGLGIIFKGSGFYATDYRKGIPSKAQENEKTACPKIKDGCQGCNLTENPS